MKVISKLFLNDLFTIALKAPVNRTLYMHQTQLKKKTFTLALNIFLQNVFIVYYVCS